MVLLVVEIEVEMEAAMERVVAKPL